MTGTMSCTPKNGHREHVTAANATQQAVFRPNVNIVETPDAVLLTADVPGADESSVDITLENSILTIRAGVATPAYEGYALSEPEYGIGPFERSFTVSQNIDRAGIDATVKDGVLRVRLPKVREAVARKIRVTNA